jgi:hypothetical protein
MGVNEAGRNVRASGIDLALPVRAQSRTDLGDQAIADPNVSAGAPVPSTTVPPRMSRSGMPATPKVKSSTG